MNFVKFESATEKERIRNELRSAREELLARAQKHAEFRAEREAERKLKGEDSWIHPSVNEKIEKIIKEHKSKTKKKSKDKKKNKKVKKECKHQRNKKKRKPSSSSSDDESSSSTEEEIVKKKKNKKRKKESSESSSDNDSTSESEDEWVEKKSETAPGIKSDTRTRDEWMTEGSLILKTFSKENNVDERKEKNKPDSYNPSTSTKELNPHWREGGRGLPAIFQRPKEDDDYEISDYSRDRRYMGNWRRENKSINSDSREISDFKVTARRENKFEKRRDKPERVSKKSNSDSESSTESSPETLEDSRKNFLTDLQMNELGAKLIKAEIMGNDELAKELKDKLEKARNQRKNIKESSKSKVSASERGRDHRSGRKNEEHILLTTTNSKGMTRPLSTHGYKPQDLYGGRKGRKRQKVETHTAGERVRYFPDDDRYDIKQMFEREKCTTGTDSDMQFAQIAGKHKNPKDDLEDIFEDKVRKGISDYDRDEKEKKRAIAEHERFTKVLESCERCFDSPKMEKSHLVAMGSTAYISIPFYEGLQSGHCIIAPMQHVSCSTQLDEDTWNEITEFRKSLVRMFASKSQEVIFFEIANYLQKRPHMEIHCVPSEHFEMAPMYFKKAIQESEYEWSTNKQLITLKDKDLRRSIPKGLPYFWVHFGMDLGFAHVIEDQYKFKSNFAQEIIGGLLQLHHKTWRKPRKEYNVVEKVKQLAEMWKPFDFMI